MAGAEETVAPDKSHYTLLKPTPAAYLREFSADRPDKTDSPFTVDAGHFQLEMDFANFSYSGRNSERPNTRSVAVEVTPMNIKAGLLNNLDLQLIYRTWRWERTEDRNGTRVEKAGFDGITPRLKLNLAGNDRGFFAVALLPFINVPLSQDHLGSRWVEGGLGIPYAFNVADWEVGLQTTFLVNHNSDTPSYHAEFDNSVSIGHRLIGRMSIYAEFFSNVSAESQSHWVGTMDTWLTYQVNERIRFDAGVHIGVTPAAEDWHPWAGVALRF